MIVKKYDFWKKDEYEIIVYFRTDDDLAARVEVEIEDSEESEVKFAVMPNGAFWSKWCPYDFIDMNEGTPRKRFVIWSNM